MIRPKIGSGKGNLGKEEQRTRAASDDFPTVIVGHAVLVNFFPIYKFVGLRGLELPPVA